MISELEILKSKESFEKILSDLQITSYMYWRDKFDELMEFCLKDLVISSVIEEKTGGTSDMASSWFEDWKSSGPRGRRQFKKITNDDESFPLVFDILMKFHNKEENLLDFCDATFQGGGRGERYSKFYFQLINPFAGNIISTLKGRLLELSSKESSKEKEIEKKMQRWMKIGVVAAIISGIAAIISAISAFLTVKQ